jgi:hypothetical protein
MVCVRTLARALALAAGACVVEAPPPNPTEILSILPSNVQPDRRFGTPGVVVFGGAADSDPYYRGTTVVVFESRVGQCEIELTNDGRSPADDIENAVVILTLNDPDLLVVLDAQRWLLWPDSFLPGPAMLTDTERLYEDERFLDYHTYRPMGRLAAGETVRFSVTLGGAPGLKLHLDVAGNLVGGAWLHSLPDTSTTLMIWDGAVTPEL